MPSPIPTAQTPRFMGDARHKVEGRNRITIPAAWRFGEEVELFMIAKSEKTCVLVMTQVELDRILADAEKLEAMERSNFFDMIGRSVIPVTMDKGGRITLPEKFFPLLGLPEAREVVLAGSMKTFSVWSVENFDAQTAGDAPREYALKYKLGI